MSEHAPRISIGMLVYNEDRHLDRALRSLLRQTEGDFEIIVSDNASSDRTAEISAYHAARDPRIRFYREDKNRGVVWNSNRVLDLARGEYFMWAGGHDLWHPTYLDRCARPLREDRHVVLSHSLTVGIDDQGRVQGIMPGSFDTRGVGQMFRFNMVQWGLINGNAICGLIRRNALEQTGRARNSLGPHLILLSELALLGTFALVPDPLFCRRQNRVEEDMLTKLQRWQRTMDPARSGRSMAVSLAHFAWEHFAVALRARVSIWPRLLLFPSIFLILVAKTGKFLQQKGREKPLQVFPGSASDVPCWEGGPRPPELGSTP